jgi:hypothetical protein
MALRALAPASGGVGGPGGFPEAGGFPGGAPGGFPWTQGRSQHGQGRLKTKGAPGLECRTRGRLVSRT